MAFAADVIVCAREEGEWQVLLIRRKNPPYQGAWAIPGGFVEAEERVEETAERELEEETGVKAAKLKLLGVYSDPLRDPRGRTVSAVYYEIMEKKDVKVRAGSDAREAGWHSLKNPPPLAFDHAQILTDLLQELSKL